MKADFLFVGSNLNTIVQEITPEICNIMDDTLNTRSIKNI